MTEPIPSPPGTAPATPPAALARPVRSGLSLLLPLLAVLVVLALVLGLSAGAGRWLLYTEPGTKWLIERIPSVKVQGFTGTLLGERWRADSVRLQWNADDWVLIEGLEAEGLRWRFGPREHAWVELDARLLKAQKVTAHNGGPPGPRPRPLPSHIAPPLRLMLAEARIDTLLINNAKPIERLQLQGLALEPRPQANHRIERFAFDGYGVTVQGGLTIGNTAPLPVTAEASVRPLLEGDSPRWAAVLRASGNVPQLDLTGTLRGRPTARQEAPAVDVRATLRPLEAWLLGGLLLQTQALDLAALAPGLPSTKLSGKADLSGGVGGSPLAASIDLGNASPGRWNEGRLPLKRLQLQLQGELARRDRVEVKRFELALADATGSAGHWSGSALWQASELTLDTRLAGIVPQRLDSRAAAMTLSGPLTAQLRGLPSPARGLQTAASTPALPAAPASANSSAPAPTRTAATQTAVRPSIDWKLDLEGRFDAAPQPVRLLLEGHADEQRLEIKQGQLRSGGARIDVQARMARIGRGPWQIDSTGKVADLDPLPWWPGMAGTAWRKGPHRLSGEWQLQAQLPPDAERQTPLQTVQRLVGNGTLRLHDSVLAGVPLSADIALATNPAAAPTPVSLRTDLRLGGNQLLVDGNADPAGNGAADRWRAELKADSLAELAPLAGLNPALAGWLPRRGSASATLGIAGRWPLLRTDGNATVSQWQSSRLNVARGNAVWRIDNGGDKPLSMQLDLAGLQFGNHRADHLRASLQGKLAEHRIEISGAMPLLPPALAEQVLGIQLQSGTRALLQGQGAWLPEARGGGRWRAQIEQLRLGSWDGSSETAPPASGWAEARDLRVEVQVDAQARVVALQAAPGRISLADKVTLRWDAVSIDLRGDQPLLQLRAEIEPFLLAPLLARAQPGIGWQGDLRLAARLDIKAAERVDAELVFERRDGDLHVVNAEGIQRLGLSEMRVALSAHDGIWNFSPVLRGRRVGDISGQVRVQTTADRAWPHADAALSGSLLADVADIGIWSAWVPPGWRLSGEVHAMATLGGRFGAPQYTGEVTGNRLAVRNLLEGVNVTEGQMAVRLNGATAQIERFVFKGGDGSVTLAGNGSFGTAPQARLQLKAERFRLIGRVDRQIVVSGSAELALLPEQGRLDGKFRLDEGLIDASRGNAPSLDSDVTVRRAGMPETGPAIETAAQKPRRNFVVALDIDLGEQLRVRGRGLDTTLRGQLRVSTPNGQLAVNGSINTERGTYAAYGQNLEIERGILAFNGTVNNPRLDVLALRPNIDTRVGVAITGNLLTPRVRLYSEPEMSDTDKLSWLVLGRAPDGLGRNDTALLQRAAIALLAGEGEAPTDALLKNLGIDELSLRQSDGDVRETVITLGKQLSRRWYLGYERGVNSTTGTWQLIYRIAQRFTLRAQSGLENSLDVIWTWRLQETPADAGMRKSTVRPQ